jgi:hypothetical protein
MAFPADPLPIKHEWLIDGVWTDITEKTKLAGEMNIVTGFAGEQASLASGTCSSTVFNRDQFFSSRVPTSANYGLFSKNVQCRASVTETDAFIRMADYKTATGAYDQAHVSTADKAVLDITGDIDVRMDIQPDHWWGGRGVMLGGKYESSGDQRSWALWLHRLGYLGFSWTTAGTVATKIDVYSDAPIPVLPRRAVRATLDVNNGSGGYTVRFYTSDSVSGTWEQLGSTITTTSGTTSIFSSTASLIFGTVNASTAYGAFNLPAGEDHTLEPFVGRIYRAQVYSGIGGTLVADMNATAQAVGTTSWSDGLATANTWATNASAEITKQDYRFWGEVGSITPNADSTGTDVTCSIAALDMLSRLRNGSKSVDSSVFANLIRYSDPSAGTDGTLDLYYAMEDDAQADRPTATIGRNGAMFDCTFTTDSNFPGSKGVLSFSSDSGWANGDGVPTGTTSNTGVVTLLFYFYSPATPAAARGLIFYRLVGGTSVRVAINVEATVYRLIIVNSSGTELLNSAVSFGTGAEPNDQWIAMRVMLTQNGGNVDYEWGWYPIGAPVLYGVDGSYAGTVGRPSHWSSPSFASKTGWALAHIAAMREELEWATTDFTDSTNAYVNEFPSERFARLCRMHRIPYWLIGRYRSDTDPLAERDRMGPQLPNTVIALLEETALVDGGYLHGPRDKFGIALRMKNSIINQTPTLVTYSNAELSENLVPRDDLFFARNQVTASRPNGGSATYTKRSGSLNSNEPADDPQGIGLYDPGPISVNVELDSQLDDYAREAVFFGTWDELRLVQATVQMHRPNYVNSAALTRLMRTLKLFDPIEISGLGSARPDLPPDNAQLIILGYAEILANRGQTFRWNTAPYKPYVVNDLTLRSISNYLAGPTNSSLDAGINGTATSFDVDTPTGRLWTTGAVDIEIKIGGEQMRVQNIAGTSSPQTFSSVTRNRNNMATTKSHSAGAAITLASPQYLNR